MALRTVAHQWVYSATQTSVRLIGVALCRIRCFGRNRFPQRGGALVCSNHQSYFDPVLVGLTSDRPMNYLARRSLFRFAPFRWLIQFYNAIPIDRDGMSLGGIKQTLRLLKQDEMVLIFPEGTRSHDGSVAPLKPGFCALARRSRKPLVPVGIDGAFDAWPRGRLLPWPTVIHICVGKPISAKEVAQFDDLELVAELERRIRDCHACARASRLREA